MEKFVKIDEIIKKLLKKYGISEELKFLYDVWELVLGKDMAEKIKLCGIKNDELLVSVESAIYHHHLKLNQNEYLQKINELLLNNNFNCEFKKIKVVKK
ncbi:MAG: DciA family protein [Elusimicrobiota bacterium]|nr:DUF721 domain-containing protein [Endomicrobiia bacterium]MCX7910446.1 DUF721 domain-containing protein [Endomicrobiia bacterium]MDW8165737.1 DciA family protein [Elusimicrobiota bacterium]